MTTDETESRKSARTGQRTGYYDTAAIYNGENNYLGVEDHVDADATLLELQRF